MMPRQAQFYLTWGGALILVIPMAERVTHIVKINMSFLLTMTLARYPLGINVKSNVGILKSETLTTAGVWLFEIPDCC
jgi:hypothetical protein